MHPEPILGRKSDAWSWTLQTMSLLPETITNDWNLRKTCQKRLEPKFKRLLLGRKTKKKQHLQTSKQPSFGVPESPAVKKSHSKVPFLKKKTRQPPSDAETSHFDSPFEQIEFHLGQSIVSVQRSLKWAPSFFVSEKKAAAKNSNTAEASMCFFVLQKQNLIYLIESPKKKSRPTLFLDESGFLVQTCTFHVLDTGPIDVVDQYPRHAPLDGVDTMGRWPKSPGVRSVGRRPKNLSIHLGWWRDPSEGEMRKSGKIFLLKKMRWISTWEWKNWTLQHLMFLGDGVPFAVRRKAHEF